MPGAEIQTVCLPHTWNGTDGQDGGDDYKRLPCKYKKAFPMPELKEGERCLIVFRGVNALAEVSLNGKLLYRHENGYAKFFVDLTDELRPQNEIEVVADNTPDDRYYPQKADFTFYGGIYRDVTMEIVPRNGFMYGEYCSPALKARATVDGNRGVLSLSAKVHGKGKVVYTLLDMGGMPVAKSETDVLTVESVHLWNGKKDPYLYTVSAELFVCGEVVDRTECKVGFRTFYVDADKGFFLNGESYPLRGVCRHQDRPQIGNAITKAEHEEDMALILEIGANTIRLAHYQHDDYFYDLCDRYGLIVWAEIPYISRHLPEGNENTELQMRELIAQLYNHPSIVTWGISNEITMFKGHREDMLENHRKLNELCHELDPDRLTTLANFAMCGPFNRVAHITDIVSWNLYLGWYVPGLFLNDLWFAFFRLVHPRRPVGMSEYGAEAMINLHSVKPKRFDNTEEYQAVYHEYMAAFFAKHDYFWATHVWNMFDFAADARNQGGEPGMNHKGLVTFDRKTRKDAFYLYKAYWSQEPFVHLCGRRFVNRTGKKIDVKIYSNQQSLDLYHNGRFVRTLVGDKVFRCRLPMEEKNEIEVRCGDLTDKITVVSVAKIDPAYIVPAGGNSMSWEKK